MLSLKSWVHSFLYVTWVGISEQIIWVKKKKLRISFQGILPSPFKQLSTKILLRVAKDELDKKKWTCTVYTMHEQIRSQAMRGRWICVTCLGSQGRDSLSAVREEIDIGNWCNGTGLSQHRGETPMGSVYRSSDRGLNGRWWMNSIFLFRGQILLPWTQAK